MSRLAAAGELVRVHHGLYWKGVQSRFGPGRPGLVDVAIAVVGPDGAGPSGWSAAQALGLSTQVPAEPEVAVAGPVPSFAGVRFHRRNNLARRDLGFWEIALLEALRSYPAYAEVTVAEFAARVRTLVAEGKVRFTRLETAARREHSPALRRNLAAVRECLPEAVLEAAAATVRSSRPGPGLIPGPGHHASLPDRLDPERGRGRQERAVRLGPHRAPSRRVRARSAGLL